MESNLILGDIKLQIVELLWSFTLKIVLAYLASTIVARGRLKTRKLTVTAMVRVMVYCLSAMVLTILTILRMGKMTKVRGSQ